MQGKNVLANIDYYSKDGQELRVLLVGSSFEFSMTTPAFASGGKSNSEARQQDGVNKVALHNQLS